VSLGDASGGSPSSEERIAQNEALFREVNERVREVHAGEREERISFLCECGLEECTETISLSFAEYEDVRSDPTQFAVAPGHEIGDVEAPIRRGDGFVLVRKHPTEATIAVETDPRS
jgi:hypothetical protein